MTDTKMYIEIIQGNNISTTALIALDKMVEGTYNFEKDIKPEIPQLQYFFYFIWLLAFCDGCYCTIFLVQAISEKACKKCVRNHYREEGHSKTCPGLGMMVGGLFMIILNKFLKDNTEFYSEGVKTISCYISHFANVLVWGQIIDLTGITWLGVNGLDTEVKKVIS